MASYWVRNKKGQVAAEVTETGLSIHDQTLSWRLLALKAEGSPPYSSDGAKGKQSWTLASMLAFLEENGYTVESQDERPLSGVGSRTLGA